MKTNEGMKRLCHRWCYNLYRRPEKRLLTLAAPVIVMSVIGINYVLRKKYVQLPLILPESQGLAVCPKARLFANTSTSPTLSYLQCLHERESVELPVLPGDSSLPYPSCIKENTPEHFPEMFPEPVEGSVDDSCLKKILFWNDDHHNKHFGFGIGREPFLAAGCRVNTCTTTADRTRYSVREVDAVIWHYRSTDRSLPVYRSPHTRFVFWMMESPSYLYGDLRDYHNVFNWTFTYRLDSDIPQPYDKVFRRRQPLPPTSRNHAAGKTKLAAWFVSHCPTKSGRNRLVETLQRRIPVDVYGKCGPLQCTKVTETSCYEMLNATYKFYFAFENSLCRDYITEKLFNILRLDVVPVVYGLGNYSALAPPHSYIDALSFPSASALADYLLYLHHNDTAYNEYFRWKRFHQQFDRWALVSQQYCALCEMLHSDTPAKSYDLHEWYAVGGHCKTLDSPDIHDFVNSALRIRSSTCTWCLTAFLLAIYLIITCRKSFMGEGSFSKKISSQIRGEAVKMGYISTRNHF